MMMNTATPTQIHHCPYHWTEVVDVEVVVVVAGPPLEPLPPPPLGVLCARAQLVQSSAEIVAVEAARHQRSIRFSMCVPPIARVRHVSSIRGQVTDTPRARLFKGNGRAVRRADSELHGSARSGHALISSRSGSFLPDSANRASREPVSGCRRGRPI